MKKSLLAIAIAAAVPAVASAQVVVSGIIKGGFSSTSYSNGASNNGTGSGLNDGSSRVIFSATEKIGDLEAFFQMDTRFRVDDNGGGAGTPAPTSGVASQIATGNTFVGIRSGMGAIQIGKMDTHYCAGTDQHGIMATALTHSSCGFVGYVNGNSGISAIANASRSTNVIRYTSPSVSGFTVQLNYSTAWQGGSEVIGTPGKGGATHGQVTYNAGPIVAGISNWNAKNEAETDGQTGLTVWGSYQFGPLNVGLTWDESSKGLGAAKFERVVTSVPVRYTIGSGTLMATWSRADDGKTAGKTVADTGATLFSIGYAYDLSKRTSIGISYGAMNNDKAAAYGLYTQAGLSGMGAPVAGQDQKQTYVGVRHTF